MKTKTSLSFSPELTQLAVHLSQDCFGKPFRHQVFLNPRLKTTGGRYCLQDHHLEINPRFLTPGRHEILIGILKHELTHYQLDLAGQDYRHQSRAFKLLLKKVSGLRYTPDIGLRQVRRRPYGYECQRCGRIYWRTRRIDRQRFVCGFCHGHLIPIKNDK